MNFSKYAYYLSSIPRLLFGITRPWKTMRIFLGWEPMPAEIELRFSGLRFKIRSAMDAWVIKETVLDYEYFPKWVRLRPAWRVVDIGGGLGDFAVLAAERCWEGVVHVYEPLAASFALLEENVALNEVENVVAHPVAVMAGGGTVALAEAAGAAVSTRFVAGEGAHVVPAVSLAEVLDRLPGGECDFMKIDCEGGEYDILLNSAPALLARIQRLSLEYHEGFTEYGGADLARHLKQHGFRVWRQQNPVHAYLGFLYAERGS